MTECDWIDVRVAARWRETSDIVCLELVSPHGTALPAFEAGAYIDVLTPGGHLRPYSLCNPATEHKRYLIAVLRERRGRGGSISLHDATPVGAHLRVRSPRNAFALAATAVHSLLLAGGIGITPLLSMADTLWRRGASFELHYSAHHAERAAFAVVIKHLPYASRVRFHWSEGSGHLDFTHILQRAPVSTHVYVCGPTAFMDSAVAAFVGDGRPSDRLHLEHFSTNQEPRALRVS